MRLRTKLVLTAVGLTFTIVLAISVIFLGELVHQRIQQTSDQNEGSGAPGVAGHPAGGGVRLEQPPACRPDRRLPATTHCTPPCSTPSAPRSRSAN